MEDKKTSFVIKILVAGNLLSLILVLGVIGYLANNKNLKIDQPIQSIPKEIATKVPEAITVQEIGAGTNELKDGIYVLEITDSGFAPEGMSAFAGQKINLEVINKSKTPYIFQIANTDTGSDPIKPGETKNFVIQPPANKQQETGYAYKAVSVDGSKSDFKGVLTFSK